MRTKKLFFTIAFAIGLAGILSACGQNTMSKADALLLADKAHQAGEVAGAKAEAAKADAKLLAAKAELQTLATKTARQGGYSAKANCNVAPEALANTAAKQNFPSSAHDDYRAYCQKEVAVMYGERQHAANKAVANAKRQEAKVAAATKAKDDKLANMKGLDDKLAAIKAKDDKLAATKAKAKLPKPSPVS